MISLGDSTRKVLRLWRLRRFQRVLKSFQVNNPKIPSWTTEDELYTLYKLARGCAEGTVGVEIGSYLGASTLSLCAALFAIKGRLICIDTWMNETMPEGNRDTFNEFYKNVHPFKNRIVTIRKRSDQIQPSDIPYGVNIAFIDGDHSYEAVRNDFGIIEQKASGECLVIFHDFRCFEGVSRTIGEALATGKWSIGGMAWNLAWIIRTEFRHKSHGEQV